jgi:small subunit ribosomal protein S4
MARYTGADCKRCRREKMKLYLKGSKCDSPKCPIEIRPYPPGEHGRARTKESEYLLQMREKQKAARIYGVLESRLDNVVYRSGFTTSRDAARQAVRHGHFLVNGKKVDIPSYRVSENDIIELRPKSFEMTPFVIARATAGERTVPAWLEVMPSKMRILVHGLPQRQVIDTPVQEQLIVELYSK